MFMDGSNTSVSLRRVAVHAWAVLTLVSTFILLCSGGIVTSKGVGMSVPDWPTTYGYNMFLFPISGWVGGIFYEHGHRLIASWVGLMTMILAASLLASEPRRWVKNLGIIAFLAVCVQGLLGGLRVTLFKDEMGIFHAMLAQSFFCLLGILTIVTSPRFIRGGWDLFLPDSGLRNLVVASTVLIFVQLGIGATMRHEHAGLAPSRQARPRARALQTHRAARARRVQAHRARHARQRGRGQLAHPDRAAKRRHGHARARHALQLRR